MHACSFHVLGRSSACFTAVAILAEAARASDPTGAHRSGAGLNGAAIARKSTVRGGCSSGSGRSGTKVFVKSFHAGQAGTSPTALCGPGSGSCVHVFIFILMLVLILFYAESTNGSIDRRSTPALRAIDGERCYTSSKARFPPLPPPPPVPRSRRHHRRRSPSSSTLSSNSWASRERRKQKRVRRGQGLLVAAWGKFLRNLGRAVPAMMARLCPGVPAPRAIAPRTRLLVAAWAKQ